MTNGNFMWCLGFFLAIFSESVTSRSDKKSNIENAVSSADIVFFFFKMSVTFYQNLVAIREKTVGTAGRSVGPSCRKSGQPGGNLLSCIAW